MQFPSRQIAFVLAASNHGTMIVNRNDFTVQDNSSFGVGMQIFMNSCFDPDEVRFALFLLSVRRRYFGDGVLAIDGGANVGVHTIEWARHMHGWGEVLSFEAQEPIFYALAGNIAINNCLNAHARLVALGESVGEITIPKPDYFSPASFGSLELRQRPDTQPIGQTISYAADAGVTVPMVNIDSLKLGRIDFIKLDLEGMEMAALNGAVETIARCKPALLIEYLKSDADAIKQFLYPLGYSAIHGAGPNLLAVHDDDPTRHHMRESDGHLFLDSEPPA